jgi:hypothetical protein
MNSGLFGALGAAPLRVIGMIKRVITSSPNADVNALQLLATGGSKNVDLVLTPKGSGALIAGPAPDGTSVGGNKRGVRAIDLQTSRSAADRVASGSSAITIGTNAIASSSNSTAIGQNVIAIANFGGTAVAIGSSAGVSASYGGVAIGDSASVGGQGGTAVGNYSLANGLNGTAIGINAKANGFNSLAFGGDGACTSDRDSMASLGGVNFLTGNSILVLFKLIANTSDTTPTKLTLRRSAAAPLTIPSGKILSCIIQIIGSKSDGSSVIFYTRKVCIKNISGTTTLVGNIETIGTDYKDNALTDVVITANDTTDSLDITVTGIAAENWRWIANVQGVELAIGT